MLVATSKFDIHDVMKGEQLASLKVSLRLHSRAAGEEDRRRECGVRKPAESANTACDTGETDRSSVQMQN